MRARFTAFCHGNGDYLIATHHPDAHSANERDETERSIAATEWLNLTIIEASKGRENDAIGIIEFAAAFRKKTLTASASDPDPTEVSQMHERSRFVQEDGQWFYIDGQQLPPHQTPRNSPCWCGSGKKTKRCHV